jgi:hypothetical protein
MNWTVFGRKQSLPNFKVLSQNSPGGTEENHKKPLVRIAGLRAEISNGKQECEPLDDDVQLKSSIQIIRFHEDASYTYTKPSTHTYET